MFERWLARWRLQADGQALHTPRSDLLPVRCVDGGAAMLKLARDPQEAEAVSLLDWWDGDGAARVLRHEGVAVLLERACGPGSLWAMARDGDDDRATRLLCEVAARLHAPRAAALPALVPLTQWFAELAPAAQAHGGVLVDAEAMARRLLAQPREVVPLHGDLHHDNVLDFGSRGWLAIDPKGLLGERGFDYANLACNPDAGHPRAGIALAPGRLERLLAIVAQASGIEPVRLLQWILAWSGLSAAWCLHDPGDASEADIALGVALRARQLLAG